MACQAFATKQGLVYNFMRGRRVAIVQVLQYPKIRYHYPASRVAKDDDEKEFGVTGTVESLQTATLAEQPVASFDWSPDKTGLFCFASFDQQIRVGMVTRLS